jgi:uncharacterized membrane protein
MSEVRPAHQVAAISRDGEGKYDVTTTRGGVSAGGGAAWGGFWGLLFGLIFFVPEDTKNLQDALTPE